MTISLFRHFIGGYFTDDAYFPGGAFGHVLSSTDERHFRCPKVQQISFAPTMANITSHNFIIQHRDICG